LAAFLPFQRGQDNPVPSVLRMMARIVNESARCAVRIPAANVPEHLGAPRVDIADDHTRGRREIPGIRSRARVFSVVFKSRWGTNPAGENKSEFAVILFVGLIVYGFFAEVINRAPGLIVSNVNYVKKVVFPLEILPIVTMAAALFHSLVSIFVLLVAFVLLNGFLHWTVLLIPFVILPLVVLVVGLAWLLASLGVFLRDLAQSISIITMVFMFLSPIFYPVTALPERFRTWFMINPLTFVIEETRAVAIFGQMPDWTGLALYFLGACLVAWFGYAWFQKTRKGFADVI
jgi:lipopolysaccharide transport system permease protein